jgi:anti-sigma factor RsiW
MTSREFTERDVHLALDGELPADERAGYERWLDAHPDMKARSGRYQADSDLLRGALAGVLEAIAVIAYGLPATELVAVAVVVMLG